MGELDLDPCGHGSGDELQMQSRAREDLEAALQYAPGGTDSGLVLIETLRGRIMAHADIDPMRAVATIRVVEQDKVDVRAAFTLRLEASINLRN